MSGRTGSGRPGLGPRVAITLRLPVELHERLTDAATERDVSANWLATRAIEEFIDDLWPVDEMVETR